MLRELHLFAGIGGDILAGEMLGHTAIGAVELSPFCRAVLAHHWPTLYQHDDIRTFQGSALRGRCELVCGGFPCQDISSAGRGAGLKGARSSLWFEMLRVVGEVAPAYVFVENSPLLRTRGLDVVLGGLADLGFDAEWGVLSAKSIGANHDRKRMWILAAHPDRAGSSGSALHHRRQDEEAPTVAAGPCEDVADAGRRSVQHRRAGGEVVGPAGEVEGQGDQRQRSGDAAGDRREAAADAGGPGLPLSEREASCGAERNQERGAATERSWWLFEPDVGRVAHGVPNRVDRLRSLGNAQVPLQAATAFRLLMDRFR